MVAQGWPEPAVMLATLDSTVPEGQSRSTVLPVPSRPTALLHVTSLPGTSAQVGQ